MCFLIKGPPGPPRSYGGVIAPPVALILVFLLRYGSGKPAAASPAAPLAFGDDLLGR